MVKDDLETYRLGCWADGNEVAALLADKAVLPHSLNYL